MKRIALLLIAICTVLQMKALQYKHSDSIDVLHYQINIEISKFSSQEIGGYTKLTIVPKKSINKFCLDLLKLNVDSVKLNDVLFSQYSHNDTLLVFNLMQELSPTDTFCLSVFYHGIPRRDPQWGGFYFSGDFAYNIGVGFYSNPHVIGRFWYPCIDDFADRATYDYFITTKPEHVAVCGGILQNMNVENDGKKTWHWHLSSSIPTYLSSVAVGPFICINDMYSGLNGTVPIQLWARQNDSLASVQTFSKLKQVMQAYEESFGPYNWQRVGYVMVPFDGGAMEHATNIAFPRSSLGGGLSTENLYAHELSHHWFGDLITCANEGDMWINEGWASFCENIFKEKVYNFATAQSHLMANHLKVLNSAHIDDGGYFALSGIPHDITYGTTVYDKGADVVHTLRHYLGDSVFFESVKQVLSQHAFQSVTTMQLCESMGAASGVNLTPFFNAWVNSPGFYHFSVDSFTVQASEIGFETTVSVRQKLRHAPQFAMANRIELAFLSENLQIIYKTIQFDGESGQQTYTIPFNPVSVMVDLNQKMADAITSEYKVIKTIGTHNFTQANFAALVSEITDSAFIQASFNWVEPDTFKLEVAGLSVTNYAYWKIDGYIPQNVIARGRFSYKASINGASVVSSDSIVLLYRASSSENWRRISADKTGGASSGTLTSRNFLQTGEYAVGLWNYAASVNPNSKKYQINVFPNPATGKINIDFKGAEASDLKILDILGKVIFSAKLKPDDHYLEINSSTFTESTYFINFYRNNRVVSSEKVVVQ